MRHGLTTTQDGFFIPSIDRILDRLCTALSAPERRNRTVLLCLTIYALLWSLYGILSKSSQDLSPDMVEEIVWSQHLDFGFLKHPPLSPLLVKLWFSVVPLTDATFYVLAALVAAAALWIAWLLAGDYLEGEKRVLALALLTFIPFFNFHALKYNVNTLLMPLWAATTLAFLRAYRTRGLGYSVLAGLGAAAALLCKYWSVFLVAGLAMAALLDTRRGAYFRSAAPWVTLAVGLIVLAPHVVWLVQHDFAPVAYALKVHGDQTFAVAVRDALGYLAGSAGYVAAPVVLVMLAARPAIATIRDMAWPTDRARRLAAVAFWGPLLLPAAAALVTRTAINSLWSMSAWALLPVLLLSPPGLLIGPVARRRILAVAIGLPVVMVLVAPALSYGFHRMGLLSVSAHSRLLGEKVERLWHEATGKPLRYIDGDVAYSIAIYADDRPRPLPDLPEIARETLERDGIAFVCIADDLGCMENAAGRLLSGANGRWVEFSIARTFLGVKGRAQRYAMLIIPPSAAGEQAPQ